MLAWWKKFFFYCPPNNKSSIKFWYGTLRIYGATCTAELTVVRHRESNLRLIRLALSKGSHTNPRADALLSCSKADKRKTNKAKRSCVNRRCPVRGFARLLFPCWPLAFARAYIYPTFSPACSKIPLLCAHIERCWLLILSYSISSSCYLT